MNARFTISACAAKALSRLNTAGFEAYLVGGSVRDLVMGREPKDWDITTSAEPKEVEAVFSECRLVETGLKHGTVTVLMDGNPLEITTYRVDGVYSDHRRPDDVRYTKNLREDLARRDFTMNALAYTPIDGLTDWFGGREDIAARQIRCVGDPGRRFEEDGLRILRALRFASVLDFEIESATLNAIHQKRSLLAFVSPERVLLELNKLLCGAAVERVLGAFPDVLGESIPEIKPMLGFEPHDDHHGYEVWQHTVKAVANTPPTPVLRWAALLHDIGKLPCGYMEKNGEGHFHDYADASASAAAEVCDRLRFDHASRDRVLLLVKYHDSPIPTERRQLRRWLNRLGESAVFELIALARADHMEQAEACLDWQNALDAAERTIHDIIDADDCFSLRSLAVNGKDLLALGFQGRQIGNKLNNLLEAVMDDKVSNSKEDLLKYLYL